MARTYKTMLVQLPIQHRTAVGRMKRQTKSTIKALMLEAIEDLAQKYGLVTEGRLIREWPDWE